VSRRTVLLLSDNFLRSEWSRYDYKSGLHQALRNRKKLIVIVLGDVASRELDPDLRLYMKNSVVLHWGEKLFWERLRFALPDVKSRVAHGTTQRAKSHSPNSTVVSSVSGDSEQLYQPRYATISESALMNNNGMPTGMVFVPNMPGPQQQLAPCPQQMAPCPQQMAPQQIYSPQHFVPAATTQHSAAVHI